MKNNNFCSQECSKIYQKIPPMNDAQEKISLLVPTPTLLSVV